jgi:hypothetical protein
MSANESNIPISKATNPMTDYVATAEELIKRYNDAVNDMKKRSPRISNVEHSNWHINVLQLRRQANEQLTRVKGLYDGFALVQQNLKKEKQTSALSQRFRRLIEQYSALELTKVKDRLPALSGLCVRAAPRRGEYVAGLWLDSLLFDLLWRIESLQPESCDRSNYFPRPSWSWI